MLISNHVSWMDIFVILSVMPIRFVSKVEVKRWPVAGYLATAAGTLYLDRSRKRDAASMGTLMRQVLEERELIGIFPEGTTTDGSIIRPFFGSLLQPAIQARAILLPTALSYQTRQGHRNTVIPFIGSQTFLQSFMAILQAPRSRVLVRFGPPVSTVGFERRGLAEKTQICIAELLGVPVDPNWTHPD
jgi:1-acyl-sn-glycerol-3-phosphate acyltransferase